MAIILFAACKKEDEDDISLKGKWNLESTVIKSFENNALIDNETIPGGGTIDFQDNGNVVVSTPGSGVDTMPYTIQAGSKVVLDGEVFEIRDLTGSTVNLFIRRDYAPGEYDEVTISLKR